MARERDFLTLPLVAQSVTNKCLGAEKSATDGVRSKVNQVGCPSERRTLLFYLTHRQGPADCDFYPRVV